MPVYRLLGKYPKINRDANGSGAPPFELPSAADGRTMITKVPVPPPVGAGTFHFCARLRSTVMSRPVEALRDRVAALLSTAEDPERWWAISDVADYVFPGPTEAQRTQVRTVIARLHRDGMVEQTHRASARVQRSGPQWGGDPRQPDRGMYRSNRKVLHVRWRSETAATA